MQRLLPDKLGMLYHSVLYDRMITFAREVTPEFPPEPVVNDWLSRFYRNDPSLHILVDFDDNGVIFAHAVIDIQLLYEQYIVVCHQAKSDKVKSFKDHKAGFNEAFEYIDKLCASINAVCSIFYTEKNTKAYESYGYKTSRVMMIKTLSSGVTDE